MKIKEVSFYLIAFLLISLAIVGCNGQEKLPSATLSNTPTPISLLATHSKSPDIRGEITAVLETNGQINAVHIEGDLEDDTKYDKATARIVEGTRIYISEGSDYRITSTNQLGVGLRIEALFTGEILERYPVSAEASEILIIP